MNITQKTQDWGNSTGIRLPKKVLQQAKWKTGQKVSINVKNSSIILTPQKSSDEELPTLDELLDGVTPENIHGEIDWGPDVGSEIIRDKFFGAS